MCVWIKYKTPHRPTHPHRTRKNRPERSSVQKKTQVLCTGSERYPRQNQTKANEMAPSANYGVQFEALMAEVCRDFGYKLVKSWEMDRRMPLDKAEIRDFVVEAVSNFFGATAKTSEEPEPEPEVEPVAPSPPKKAKGKAKGKAPAKKAKAPEPEVEEPEEEAPPAKGKAKAPAAKASSSKKPKCQALTAKGAPCSKCAVEGSTFCSVHDPSKGKAKAPVAKASSSKAPVAKGKGGKAPAAKGKGKADESVPASVKHTHGLDELDYENCDLCKSHGGPFELPEYESVTLGKKSWADEAENEDPDDPDYEVESVGGGGLSEEDFDEDE